ncbi:hypothetical protein ACFQZT_23995 [Paenibacillus sp. GCM10027628]|uniref:hypothetical protein n=1 Tax=Paenibacillus sp. GCM10027628 TaxID=3273413 RepID=UPI003628E056
MRVSHRRSLFGYGSKEVEKHVAAMKLQFEKTKSDLEAELLELNQMNQSMLEEIAFRKQELGEHAIIGKELEGLLQKTHQEQLKPKNRSEQPEIPLTMERKRAK